MAVCSRIRQFHPAAQAEVLVTPEARVPGRKRGRPKGSRSQPKPVPVRHQKVFGICFEDHPEIPPALWNLLVSLTVTVFKGLLKIAGKLRVEAPGAEQEQLLFQDLPRLFFRVVRELAEWWWSYDRGFLGTTLTCPRCGEDLAYRGDKEKKAVTLFGHIRLRRAYYRCTSATCSYSVRPLDVRLGLDESSFLPSVQEVVAWLTSLDPYGKCLAFVGKLLSFTICHRSAWLITQRLGEMAKAREDADIARAFGDPRNSRVPAAEVEPPEVGALMVDGTCGRVDKDKVGDGEDEPSHDDDPDAPPKKPDFREVKLGLAGHLQLPTQKQDRPAQVTSCDTPTAAKRQRKHKVRPAGEEPTLTNKKLAVQLGKPLRLFQLMLLLVYRLGLDKAKTILVIGDGAKWIWCGVREHFSSLGVNLVEILDYWHAVEHLWGVANSVFGQGSAHAVAWVKAQESRLLKGSLTDFFDALNALSEQAQTRLHALTETAEGNLKTLNEAALDAVKKLCVTVDKEINYFRNNEARLHYAEYLASGYLIGSGAMEGSCKHHVKERIDGPGMHWSAAGAMAVLRNRTLIRNGDWEAFRATDAQSRWQRYQQLTSSWHKGTA